MIAFIVNLSKMYDTQTSAPASYAPYNSLKLSHISWNLAALASSDTGSSLKVALAFSTISRYLAGIPITVCPSLCTVVTKPFHSMPLRDSTIVFANEFMSSSLRVAAREIFVNYGTTHMSETIQNKGETDRVAPCSMNQMLLFEVEF